jgi:predicted ATPase/DNA-binding SARP family transcriptional activator
MEVVPYRQVLVGPPGAIADPFHVESPFVTMVDTCGGTSRFTDAIGEAYRRDVEIGLLGSLDVVDDAGTPIKVGGPRVAMLLTILALRCGEVVSDDALIEALWPASPPREPANALQRQVSRLRTALDKPDGIVRRGSGYALSVERSAVDIFRFDELTARAYDAMRVNDVWSARSLLDEALGLWRGDPLADVAYEDFAQQEIARLAEARLVAIEVRIDADLALGRDTSLISELEQLVAGHPFREHFRGQLMLALSRSGRQAEALRAYQNARDVLGEELGLEPSAELRQLENAILQQDSDVVGREVVAPARPRTNLRTPLTSLIGRQAEMERLRPVLDERRLVTLVGPGGVGKSRLAHEAARTWVAAGDAEVWMVELAALNDENEIVPAIMNALGLPRGGNETADLPSLIEYLRSKHVVLILDNCEHLVTAAARVAQELLESCPSLRIWTTSREGLAVPGEMLWAVPPLDLDDAVALFVERGRAADPASDVSADSPNMKDTLAEICGRLDGLPLAIELAAARLRAMPVVELADGLENRFRVLTRGARTALPRQQTLRAVVDWSYDLLFEDERTVFNRLSVFRGSCSLAAARVVCADHEISGDDVSELIARLVDKSIVMVETDEFDGYGRCHMLQTLVDYGRDRLEESGNAASIYDAHVRYYADFAARSIAALCGYRQRGWLRAIAANMTNLRAALDVAVDKGDAELAYTIAGGLGWYWWINSRALEASQWLALARSCPGPVSDIARARVLAWTAFADAPGFVKWGEAGGAGRVREPTLEWHRSLDETAELTREAVALYSRVPGSEDELAAVEMAISVTFSTLGDLRQAAELFADAYRLLTSLDRDPVRHAMATFARGRLAFLEDRYDDAEEALRESADLLGSTEISLHESQALRYVARAAAFRGEYAVAIDALEHACDIVRSLDLTGTLHLMLGELGEVLSESGERERARAILSELLAWAREFGFVRGIAECLAALALTEWRHPRPLRAALLAREGLAAAQAIEHFEAATLCATVLGWAVGRTGDLHEARAHQLVGLDIATKTAFPRTIAFALEGLAATALLEHDGSQTARLLGAAARLREAPGAAIGFGPAAGARADVDALLAAARDEDDGTGVDAAFAQGAEDPDGLVRELLSATA